MDVFALCLPRVEDKCVSLSQISSGCPPQARQQPKFYNYFLAKSHPTNSHLAFTVPDQTHRKHSTEPKRVANQGQDIGCSGYSRVVPNHVDMAAEGWAGLGRLLPAPRPPCPKQHLGKHAKDLLVDVVDAAGVHLILELCPQGGVLLGGEEEGGGVAAPGQGGPAG